MEQPTQFVSRKNARKQERKVKKLQKAAYHRHENIETYMKKTLLGKQKKGKRKVEKVVQDETEHDEVPHEAPQPKKKAKQSKLKHDDSTLTYEQYLEDVKNLTKNTLMGSMQDKEDDRSIHTYSRLLGLNKSNKKSDRYENDGLGGLLEFCDAEDRSKLDDYYMTSALEDMESDDTKKVKKGKKSARNESSDDDDVEDEEDYDDDSELEDEDDENAEGFDEAEDEEDADESDAEGLDEAEDEEFFDESESEGDDMEELTALQKKTNKKEKHVAFSENLEDSDDADFYDETDEDDHDSAAKKKPKNAVKKNNEDAEGDNKKGNNDSEEDIYGRKINKRGNLIDFDPQAAQKKLLELEATMPLEQRQRMEKTLISIINKVSDVTLIRSRTALLDVWNTCSKNEVKKILANIFMKMISAPYRLPDVMLLAYAMLMNLIHSTISTEISAHLAEILVCDYINCLRGSKVLDDKSLDNKTVLISFLVLFKVLKTEFILDMLNHMSENITEEALHQIYLFATYVYMIAKKSCSLAFFQKLGDVHSAYETSSITDQSRARFVADQIAGLKKTGPTSINTTLIDSEVKLLRGLYKQHKFEAASSLAMTIKDLLHADETGRWWIVGSAYRLADDVTKNESHKKTKSSYSEDVLAAASRARMNTETRRNIFCAVSSSETLDDAVVNVLQLKLKGRNEREIVAVLLYMMLAGKTYNPFYFSLLEKLCETSKRHQITLKYAIWDKLKDIKSMNDRKRDNLMHFLSDVIRKEALPITVLKVIDWVAMTVDMAKLLKGVVSSLEGCGEAKLNRIMIPLTQKANNSDFADGFRVFLEQANMRDSSLFRRSIRLLDNSVYC